jgi:predicted O-methyltransferase YrrM
MALNATDLVQWAYDQVDMAPHIATLTRLARKCETIVEFGVRGAVSTWALLDGLPATGLMYSVEVNGNHNMPPRVTSDPRWTLIIGDDLDPAVHAQLPDHADLVFIDTTHEYEQTVAELAYALTLTPDRIVMHDYVMEPVLRAGTEFCAREGWRVRANELPFGLATLVPE